MHVFHRGRTGLTEAYQEDPGKVDTVAAMPSATV
jgi:hypothetical protein